MSGPINPVQYILMDPSVEMSEGKARAQAAHASVEGVRLSGGFDAREVQRWSLGGHYAKVVLGCTDLYITHKYLEDRGFPTAVIIDEGRTEFESPTMTALGSTIVNKNDPHTAATFGEFKLFRLPPVVVESDEEAFDRLKGRLGTSGGGLTDWLRERLRKKS